MTDLITAARQALGLIDLTSLNDDDTDERIAELCSQAVTPHGNVAAVCVFPDFVRQSKQALTGTGVKVATVTNFPHGSNDIQASLKETRQAIADGADEIDVVFPYRALIQGDSETGSTLVSEHVAACRGKARLKVIIETGELKSAELIRQASNICIQAGADFIKTSTGKVAVNATPESARIMLECIRDSGKDVSFKAAGGVRSSEEAAEYLQLARDIMGDDWITADHFRFGASSLLGSILATLDGKSTENSGSGY